MSWFNLKTYGLLRLINNKNICEAYLVSLLGGYGSCDTLIPWCNINGYFYALKYLVEKYNFQDENDVLYQSIRLNRLEHVKYWIGSRHFECDVFCFDFALIRGDVNMIRYLLEEGGYVQFMPRYTVEKASGMGHLEIVIYLIEVQKYPFTPISRSIEKAAKNGHLHVIQYFIEKHHARVTLKAIHDAKTDEIHDYLSTRYRLMVENQISRQKKRKRSDNNL